MSDHASALADAAAELEDAAKEVADAASDVTDAPATVSEEVDTTPIANAISDVADSVVDLDHEGRLAALEARLSGDEFARREHYHGDYAFSGHTHEEMTQPTVEDIPAPEPPSEITENEEPTDEPPARTHLLLARPFAKGS